MNTRIEEMHAERMSSDDAKALLQWRDATHETMVAGFDMQGLLDLYHMSEKYIDLESWAANDPNASIRYQNAQRGTHGPRSAAIRSAEREAERNG